MAWSRIKYRGRHFDSQDAVMEVWLRLVTDEMKQVRDSPEWLSELCDDWRRLVVWGGGIVPDLDENVSDDEHRLILLALCEKALTRLRSFGDPISSATLNALETGPEGSTFTGDVEASVFLEGANAFIALLRNA